MEESVPDGPQTEKARFPNWVRVRTTKAALVVEERSWQRPDSAVLNCTMLLSYAGYMDPVYKLMLYETSSKQLCLSHRTKECCRINELKRKTELENAVSSLID